MRVEDLRTHTKRIENAHDQMCRSDVSQAAHDRAEATARSETFKVMEHLRNELSLIFASEENELTRDLLRSFLSEIEVDPIVEMFVHPSEAYGHTSSLEEGWMLPDEKFEMFRLKCEQYLAAGNKVEAFIAAATAVCAVQAVYISSENAFLRCFKNKNKLIAMERQRRLGPIRAAIATAEKLAEDDCLSEKDATTVVNIFRSAELQLGAKLERTELDTETAETFAQMDSRGKQVGESLLRLFTLFGFEKGRRGRNRDLAAHYAVAIAASQGIRIKANTWRIYPGTPADVRVNKS